MCLLVKTLSNKGIFDTLRYSLYYSRLMLKRLPDFVEPFKLADEEKGYSGSIALSEMPRLVAASASEEYPEVHVQIHFGRDEFNIKHIRGHAQCSLQMVCQRCMERMDLNLAVDIALALVTSDDEGEEHAFPENYEPLVVSAGPMKLAAIIEDELLLALPVVAVHDDAECNRYLKDLQEQKDDEKTEKKDNPFSILKEFKSKKS